MKQSSKPQFVVCLNNEEYEASLEVRKIYEVIADSQAKKHHMIRIIDELSEDYLYPSEYFEPIESVNEKLRSASEMDVSDILDAIPDREPLPGDELP